jgi:protease I
MAEENLDGVRVAVLVSDGFEQVEFDRPVQALVEAGAHVDVLAEDEDHLDEIQGMDHLDKAAGAQGNKLLREADPETYDALFIPGGAVSPDTMRQSKDHLDFAKAMVRAGKPVASICHGPWVLADAEVLQGRALTSWEGIRRDLERAGATWKDEPVVRDGNLLTSRKPDDLDAFVPALVELFATARREAEAPSA